jgi:hypothetical protein
MEKERDTETSLLNFIERAKHNFSPLQRTGTFASIGKHEEKNLTFYRGPTLSTPQACHLCLFPSIFR